jgi:prepilin-type N-terminal cleavage/methylation domain-containing protein
MVSDKRKRANGFTLHEVMIAIALIVSAMAIVGPPTVRTMHRSTLRAASEEVKSLYALARALAMQSGRLAILEIVPPQGQLDYTLSVEADTSSAGTGRVLFRRSALTRAEFVADRAVLCFDSRGIPTTRTIRTANAKVKQCEAPDVTIIVKSGGRADTLSFSPLGELIQ